METQQMLDIKREIDGRSGLHAAKMESSARLQRVHSLLSDGREHTTLQIALDAKVCAVNSIVAELRANGCKISCRQGTGAYGRRVWRYRMEGKA